MEPPGPPDALLLVSFGGPEGADDVLPFLEHVTRGRAVPRSRLLEVAEHYLARGGVSPINAHNRALLAALRQHLGPAGGRQPIPVYWGNRNWHPFLADTVAEMAADGIRHAAAFVTSAYASFSGCRQYRQDLEAARAAVGPAAPRLTKLRTFHDHPGFVEPLADALQAARSDAGDDAPVIMTAHSIPVAQARTCDYERQLRETAELVAERAGVPAWTQAFQSRSGPPEQPWLGPDIGEVLAALPAGTGAVVVAPIGFVSDHMEVVHDLDDDAAAVAARRGTRLVRAATPGDDPRFVAMVGELLDELGDPPGPVRRLGRLPLPPCDGQCCPAPARSGAEVGAARRPSA